MSRHAAADSRDRSSGRALYLPGGAVAVITADCALLVAGGDRAGADRLYEVVAGAVDARSVLAAAAGGRVLDLDALPDVAMVFRGPAGVRVLLSGRARCTVHDQGHSTELDGSEVALLGEWAFPAEATVELIAPDAASGEATWPVTDGVVLADRVRWGLEVQGRAMSSSSPSRSGEQPEPTPPVSPAVTTEPDPTPNPSPAVSAASEAPETSEVRKSADAPEISTAAPAPVPPSTPTPAPAPEPADATLISDETIDPPGDAAAPDLAKKGSGARGETGASAEPSTRGESFAPSISSTPIEPGARPGPAPDRWDDEDEPDFVDGDEIDDVDYTIGGGIDYSRMSRRRSRTVPVASAAPSTSVAPVSPEPVSPQVTPPAQVAAPAAAAAAAPSFDPAPTQSPAPAVRPDLAGDTVSPEVAAQLRSEAAGDAPAQAEPDAAGGETAARLCPQNHANPPQMSMCRLCSAPLDGPTVRIARPSLGMVRVSTGMFFDLDRPLLLGREPRLDGVDADSAPRLIVLQSPDKAISRNHVRVDIDGWSVHAVDLGSTNGTYLRRGAADDIRLMPDEPKMLMAGDVLVVDDVQIRFEDLP